LPLSYRSFHPPIQRQFRPSCLFYASACQSFNSSTNPIIISMYAPTQLCYKQPHSTVQPNYTAGAARYCDCSSPALLYPRPPHSKPLYQIINKWPHQTQLHYVSRYRHSPPYVSVLFRSSVHKRTLLTSEFDPLHTKLI
jgi:hypothetical protein